MKDMREYIEGYAEIKKEIEVCRKYGIDYQAQKEASAEVLKRLHPHSVALRVAEIIEETSSCKTLRMVSTAGYLPPFQAGQYINLFVEVDKIRTSRPYSISSSPRQRAYYDITVRRIDNGFVSDYLLDSVRVGDVLSSSGPSGNFYYNPLTHGKNLVFLAGGSGITPFMSMIRELIDTDLDRDVHLIYGNRTEQDILFHHELKEYAMRSDHFHYDLVLSEPQETYAGYRGFINGELISQITSDIPADTYYLCGPQAMNEFCQAELLAMGVPARKIRREMFGSTPSISSEPGWPQEVEPNTEFSVVVRGKKTIQARAGESLLSALEKEGILIPVCCRSGECSLCRVKLLSGKVFQARGTLVRESDRKYGYIHSCKSYPLDDLEILL